MPTTFQRLDKYVGKRIREARDLCDMTQPELAACIGVTFQQVQKYEKGENRVSASRLYHAAKALDVSVGWFFEGFKPTDG